MIQKLIFRTSNRPPEDGKGKAHVEILMINNTRVIYIYIDNIAMEHPL